MYKSERINTILKPQINFVKTLDSDKRKTLEWYSNEGYQEFNEKLRKGGFFLNKDEQHHLQNLEYIFANIPKTQESLTVYRGISHTVPDSIDFDNEKEYVSKFFNLYSTDAYISTSLDKDVSLSFTNTQINNCCLMHITVNPNLSVIPLKIVSKHSDEEEILLNRGGKLFITSLNYDYTLKLYVVHVSYIDGVEIKSSFDEKRIIDAVLHENDTQINDNDNEGIDVVEQITNTIVESDDINDDVFGINDTSSDEEISDFVLSFAEQYPELKTNKKLFNKVFKNIKKYTKNI